jgi:putative transposase
MTRAEPAKLWWTANEIAEAGLRGMPDSRQGVEFAIKQAEWRSQPDYARRREGRGGGWEYHWKLFPDSAQRQLLAAIKAPVEAKPAVDRDAVWGWFEGLPASVQDKARVRLLILQKVEALCAQSHETKR